MGQYDDIVEKAQQRRKLLRDSRTLGLYLISLADAVDTGAVEAQVYLRQRDDGLAAKFLEATAQ